MPKTEGVMQKSFWKKVFGRWYKPKARQEPLALVVYGGLTGMQIKILHNADEIRGWTCSALIWLRPPTEEETAVTDPIRKTGSKFFHLYEIGLLPDSTMTREEFDRLPLPKQFEYLAQEHQMQATHLGTPKQVLDARVECFQIAAMMAGASKQTTALHEIAAKGGKEIKMELHDGHWARVTACAALGLRKPSNPK
jgi:hypothetical protein